MAEADPKTAAAQATVATEGLGNGTEAAEGNQAVKPGETAGGEGLKLEGFSDEERGKLARFKSHNEIAKSYLELEKHLGVPKERLLVLPGEKASAEERVALYRKLGRPESEAEYELEKIYFPDTLTEVDMGNAEFRKVALAANLTKEQAKALHKFAATEAVNQVIRAKAEMERRRTEANQQLRTEYGAELESRKAQIPLSFNKYPGKESLIQFLNEGPGNDPRLVRFLIWTGGQFAGDNFNLRGGPVQDVKERKPGQLDYSKVSPELRTTTVGQK